MNRLSILVLILLVVFVSDCASPPEQYTELERRVVDTADSQSILIQVNHGEVIVSESEGHRVEVDGQALIVDEVEYQVSSAEKQILIRVQAQNGSLSTIPLRVNVRIPKEMMTKIELDSASVFVSKYRGNLEVASISGNITIEQAIGRVTLRSNRGNITVRESSGDVSVVGNYGALKIQNAHGEVAVSTIMGNVEFDGLLQGGDAVRLETDHGLVLVHLIRDSNLSLQVHSTSGDVTCMLPGVSSSTRSCDGKIGAGDGALKIRTVSGAVTLQLSP